MDGRDDTRPQPTFSQFLEATFVNGAGDPADTLFVRIASFGDDVFGDPDGVVWTPSGGALPQAGDRALVAESDDGTWWVIAWWSSAQDTGVSESEITALDGRLDLVEAALGGAHIAFGTGTATFSASQTSGTVVVPHSLGTTPVIAIAGSRDNLIAYTVAARSSTTISVIGFVTSNVTTTATRTFDWVVIG